MKDLRIFEDYASKGSTELPDYSEGTPTFQGFLLADNDDEKEGKDMHLTHASGQKVLDVERAKQPPLGEETHSTRASDRKVLDAEKAKQSSPPRKRSRKVNDAEAILSKVATSSRGKKVAYSHTLDAMKTRTGRTVKLSAKARDARSPLGQKSTPAEQSSEIEDLIVQLTHLLGAWEEDNTNAMASQVEESESAQDDPLKILATRINLANAVDQDQFACSTQLDIEEPETYARAMQGPNAAEWARAIEEELDQLEKNNTWELVHKSNVQPGYRPLGGKWVYKIKRDIDGNIARSKARWVVKGYLQQFGVDFNQTFAAVVKPMAFRVLVAIAAFFDLDIDQMDVKAAFLYGLIDQLVYVEIPKGTESATNRNMVCKLLKALYSLRQSSRLWYKRLSNFFLEKLGLRRINADHSIFVTNAGLDGPVVTTFVDDIKIMAPKGS